MLQHPILIRVVFFDHSNIRKVFNPSLQTRNFTPAASPTTSSQKANHAKAKLVIPILLPQKNFFLPKAILFQDL
ncbi:hypothetical protein PanWU01x14_322690 [Parasponia andersonii]|uniref:Uncharacterized protein n=1 Tax=Parasponia andersonii TaxID=3476 RepID=A0A2P5AKS4_PARAD|nr:hypothetical protein PanWU01x14_322690 [Parasponia andersonii]